MTSWIETDGCELLDNTNIHLDEDTKFHLFDKCQMDPSSNTNRNKYLVNSQKKYKTNINTYKTEKVEMKKLEESRVTINEELNSNKGRIAFQTVENNMIAISILLLIFFIYRYILR